MNKREYSKLANHLVRETKKWFIEEAGYGKGDEKLAIVGISGGKDSAVVAAICAKALGPRNVIGVMMPNGVQRDIDDAKKVCNHLGIVSRIVSIGAAFQSITRQVAAAGNLKVNVATNLPSRLRMATLYAWANGQNGRVIGTGNKSEILCGYYTLWGDGACDFDPIADLYVDEVIGVGLALGLPEEIVRKPPDDGMSGKTDEDKLGFTYDQLKKFLRTGGEIGLPGAVRDRIKSRFETSSFKRHLTEIPCASIDRKDWLFLGSDIDLAATLDTYGN